MVFVIDTVCMDVSDRNAPLSLLMGPEIYTWVSGCQGPRFHEKSHLNDGADVHTRTLGDPSGVATCFNHQTGPISLNGPSGRCSAVSSEQILPPWYVPGLLCPPLT
jgi:hypothetical protein